MTLYEFRLLDETEQTEALRDAVYLMDRTDGAFRYELYQRDGFYIELKHHLVTGVSYGMRPFKNTAPLDAYFNANEVPSGAFDNRTPPDNEQAALLEELRHLSNSMRRTKRRIHILFWFVFLPSLIVLIAWDLWRLMTGRM